MYANWPPKIHSRLPKIAKHIGVTQSQEGIFTKLFFFGFFLHRVNSDLCKKNIQDSHSYIKPAIAAGHGPHSFVRSGN